MLGDAAAVTLLGDLVEPGFSDGKDGAEAFAVYRLGQMGGNVVVDLHRQILVAQSNHPLQAQIAGHSLEEVGGGTDIVRAHGGEPFAGSLQFPGVHREKAAFFRDFLPARFVVGVGEDVAEEQVSNHDVAQMDRRDRLRQSCVALVNVGVMHGGSSAAGFLVAADAALLRPLILPDQAAEFGPSIRVGGDLVEIFIEDRDADVGNSIEIPQQGGQFFQIEGGYHGGLLSNMF